jgi:hypothetical protein
LYELVLSIGLIHFSHKMKSRYWPTRNIDKIGQIIKNG